MSNCMTTEDMLPVLDKLDKVGYDSIDAWGGAIFESCLRFLSEDPWERLRAIKKGIKNTPILMLVRGQNLLGYRHYSDETVELFIRKSVENGVNIVRAYDPLNDLRNLKTIFTAAHKEGAHIQGTLCYTESPYNSTEGFVKLACELADMGAQSICLKDMSGILTPYKAGELITSLKEYVKLPLQLHSHCTAGLASMTYLKAIEAGVDAVDCAISPLSMGLSQPATESIAATLAGTTFDPGLNMDLLSEIAEHFVKVSDNALSEGKMESKYMRVDINALKYQLPGGMLNNLLVELKQGGKEDKYNEVLKEISRVREDLGFPPLVTPTSQIIGSQALMNVIAGERYKVVSNETKAFVKGEFGRTPGGISESISQLVLGEEKPISVRPADLIVNELAKAKSEINGYYEQEEDILTYMMLTQPAVEYFKFRQAAKYKIDSSMVDFEDRVHPV
jgi:oxaloacetate decarboxylase alpha subunit